MPAPVAYNDFLNQNGALVNDGGPWAFSRNSGDVNCGSSNAPWCNDVPYCLSCWVYPSASLSSYTVTFSVNISVPMNQYGNADSLDYDMSYRVDWASSKTARGTGLTSRSTIGSNSFSNNFAADDYEELLHTRQTWVGDPFTHSGNTPVNKGSDIMGYIPISVELTFPREVSAYINYYMKAYTFRITTPTSIVQAPPSSTPATSPSSSSPVSTTTSSSTSTSSVTSSSLSSVSHLSSMDQTSSQPTGGGASIASSSSNNTPSPSNKVSTAAIAGGVIGAVALLGALIILFLLYRRRKQRRVEAMEKVNGTDADQQSFWVTSSSRPPTMPTPTTNINTPPSQHNATPFVIPSHPPNPNGYAFDYGSGAAMTSREGPPSPQNSITQWIQNNAQAQYYNANDPFAAPNVRRAPSVARSVARTGYTATGTDAPPPAYIAPSALGIDVPPLPTPRNFGYGTPRPFPPASISESESFPASASALGGTSSGVGGTFVAADAGLSQWARENRSYITEKLEMKLDAAGYVPADDPDNIDEEEWRREWGVTKLELTRMRALYARTQEQIQAHQTHGPLVL